MVNALEARYFYKLFNEECKLLIFEGASEKNLKQIKSLIDTNSWSDVTVIKGNQHRLFRYRTLYYLQNYLRRISEQSLKKVFIGEYRSSIFRHIANRYYRTSQVILLDDGSATLEVARMRIAKNVDKHFHTLGKIRQWIDSTILGVKDGEIPKITFFTIYDKLEIPSYDAKRINTYEKLKGEIGYFDSEDIAYFVGVPLVEMDILSLNNYLEYLKEIKNDLIKDTSIKSIYYVPHRREAESKLTLVSDLFPIKRFSGPLEIKLIEQRKIPKKIATFYSTFVDNCVRIFGSKLQIKVYILKLNDVNPSYTEKVQEIYKYYQENYSNEIEITSLSNI